MVDQAGRDFIEWHTMQYRGRQRIQKASKDPAARAKLLAGILPPGHMTFVPQRDDIQLALKPLPAYCTPTTASASTHGALPTETHPSSFLRSFPAEVRNAIYQYVVSYPTCRELYDAYYHQVDTFQGRKRKRDGKPCGFTPKLYTPTILLLCKQITREALTFFRLCPFVIDRIPPWVFGDRKPLPFTHFIGKSTLQNLRFAEIKLSIGDCTSFLSGCVWLEVMEGILRAWSEKNSLVRLKVMIKVSEIDDFIMWTDELDNFREILKVIDHFAFKHGSKPDLVQYEHWVLDRNYAYKCGFRNPQIRKHPDPHIWQGSALEWI